MSTDAGIFAHLGDTIVVLRHLRGLSQAELSARAGIRPNKISRYETSQVLPQIGQLDKLLRALDVGLPELVFAMDHRGRTAQLLGEPERLPAEELLCHSVTAYWRQVSDLHLEIATEVRRVVEKKLGSDGQSYGSGQACPLEFARGLLSARRPKVARTVRQKTRPSLLVDISTALGGFPPWYTTSLKQFPILKIHESWPSGADLK